MIKSLNAITLLILIAGGVNWAIVGIFDFDVVTVLFGNGPAETGSRALAARAAYLVIGLAALWQFGALWNRLTPKRD